jgi:hypothetical protein
VKKQNWSENATVLWEQKYKEKRESRVPRTLTGSILIAQHHSDLMNLNLKKLKAKNSSAR